MKPLMYHYVRPSAPGLPHFPFLRLADFERQLDYFAETYGCVSRASFLDWVEGGVAPEGVLLTFDDGLRDHLDFVVPALRQRGFFAIFYIPSAPILRGTLLDVHKVHLALGRLGGPAALAWIKDKAPNLVSSDLREPATHYAAQKSDRATKLVKDLFNWQLPAEDRAPLLDGLLDHAFADAPPAWNEIYLDREDLRVLREAGMGVGPHGHRHLVSGLLSAEEEWTEIETSCAFIQETGSSLAWGYCYPYGAFSERTEAMMAKAQCPFALAVRAGDITERMGESRRYALPRYNCNTFPHGAASFGELTETDSLSAANRAPEPGRAASKLPRAR